MERIAEATQDNSMAAYVVSKKTMEVNHKHSIGCIRRIDKADSDRLDSHVGQFAYRGQRGSRDCLSDTEMAGSA